MPAQPEQSRSHRALTAFANAPWPLLAFTAFAVFVTLLDCVYLLLFAPESLREQVVPITGWNASTCYSFSSIFAVSLIFQDKERHGTRKVIVFFLILQIAMGCVDILQMGREDYGNPYLMISLWRPVWTIAIPCFWIAVLYSPAMRRYCEQSESSPHQLP